MNTPASFDPAFLDVDVAIAGGGLVGASLALALSQLELSVALIESHPFGVSDQPSFDDRTSAMSNGSRRIFEGLNVWPLIERDAIPIRRLHISDQGQFGFARLDAAEQGLPALGYVVTNRVVGAALWRRLRETNVRIVAPMSVLGAQLEERRQRIECVGLNGEAMTINARLAVAADGAQSALRTAAGVGARSWRYDQTAITSNVLTQRFHNHVAYERFTSAGPIALLPMSEGRLGLVWTLAPDEAARMTALPDDTFLARFQDAFGFRLGRFTRVGVRQLYPLTLTQADAHIGPRLAIVGNAAQALHPIAGQGFNLGLRDAASLAEVLADGRTRNRELFDPGDGVWLNEYRAWRETDRDWIVRFTDGLVRLFTQPLGPIKALRNVGLLAFDLSPRAKHAMSQLSLGAAGRIPRLARGAPLI